MGHTPGPHALPQRSEPALGEKTTSPGCVALHPSRDTKLYFVLFSMPSTGALLPFLFVLCSFQEPVFVFTCVTIFAGADGLCRILNRHPQLSCAGDVFNSHSAAGKDQRLKVGISLETVTLRLKPRSPAGLRPSSLYVPSYAVRPLP